ncbi:MAG: class I SAM-dependent methyltransferase [Woeseiaceae bacterium]|nr:class I SAM-dependent methyltransferase [Woeseiaceae bacterium]
MAIADRQRHWQRVYGSKQITEVSWYQPRPENSLKLIRDTGVPADTPIIDVGSGASTLVDHLLDEGYSDVTVLDIAASAFEHVRRRLGPRADRVEWVVSDVTRFDVHRSYGLWHDRAVFHFLTDAADRDRYVQVLDSALSHGAHLVLSTFGPQGPSKCSGLDVRRYDINMLAHLLGDLFELDHCELETHTTPAGSTQQFLYSSWIRSR